MAELATIARPYAQAFFRAVPAAGQAAALHGVQTLAAIAQDAQLRQIADDPRVGGAQLLDIITGAAGEDLPAAAQQLLRVIVENGRLAALPEVARQFRALVNEASGAQDAIIYSAFAIDAKTLKTLKPQLEARFGRKLNVAVQIDKSLIGGIRVVAGDEVLDASVKASLQQMQATLAA